MLTRPFSLLLAVVALIAVGLGVVVGSRSASKPPRIVTLTATDPTAASEPAAADDTPAAPAVKPIELAHAPTAGVAPHRSESDNKPKSKDNESVVAKKELPAKEREGVAAISPSSADSKLVFVSRAALLKIHHAVDEGAAIETLFSIQGAQAQVQYAGAIDTDNDGTGEYGFFGELCGAVPCRAAAGEKRSRLNPPVLGPTFAHVTANGNLERSGYLFRIYLPGAVVAGKMPGIAEGPAGGWNAKGARPDHANCEVRWCCYAWPIEAGNSGTRAFFIDQEGHRLVLANTDGIYSGDDHAPAFDAASTHPGDMEATPIEGARHTDGQAWARYSAREPRLPALVAIGPATAADVATYNKPDSKEDKVVVAQSLIEQLATAAVEGQVVSNVHMTSSAQAQAQTVGTIDTDKDGEGEYGFFGELAGTAPCRAPVGMQRKLMQPHVLSYSWGKVTNAGNVVMDGYVYRIYLPTSARGKSPGLSEAPGGGCATSGPRPDHEAAEILWALYAWPVEAGKTGRRAFFMNQEYDLLVMENEDGAYSGEDHPPTFDAALSAKQPGDMMSPLSTGEKSVDGHIWSPMN